MPTAIAADGTQHDFPAGTDPSVIDRVMKQYATKASPAPAEQYGPSAISPRAEALKETITGVSPKKGQQLFTDLENLTKQFRSQGLSDEQIQQNPQWQAAAKANARSVSSGVSNTAAGVAGADVAFPALGRLAAPLVRVFNKATGRIESEAANEILRDKLSRIASQKTKLAEKSQEALIKRQASQNELARLGFDTRTAQALSMELEAKDAAAERAAADLEQLHAGAPQMQPEEFGAAYREAQQKAFSKFDQIRRSQSKIADAIKLAGKRERVNTSPILDRMNQILREEGGRKNPELNRAFAALNELLQTTRSTDQQVPQITLADADSLKDTLMKMVRRGEAVPNERLDHKAIIALNEIRKKFVRIARDSWAPYDEAMTRYRALSPEINQMERNLGVEKMLEVDPINQAHTMSEIELVGKLISRLKVKSNPGLEHVLAESPDLQQKAEQYFAHDLFGTGEYPSSQRFTAWLGRNQKVLERFGLYDKFKSMQAAHATALETAKSIKGELTMAQQLVKQREAAERAGEQAASRSAQEHNELEQSSIEYGKMSTDLELAINHGDFKRGSAVVSNFATKALREKKINPEEYYAIQDQLFSMRGMTQDRKRVVAHLREIARLTAYLAGGWGIYRIERALE